MEKVAKKFKYKGHIFKQLERNGNIAIYEQNIDGVSSFEVVVITVQKEYERFGKIFSEKETYPGNEMWGRLGVTYLTYKDAYQCFENIVAFLRSGRKPDFKDCYIIDEKKKFYLVVKRVSTGFIVAYEIYTRDNKFLRSYADVSVAKQKFKSMV